MKKSNLTILAVSALLMFAGCSSNSNNAGEKKTYAKTPAEVYAASCVKCHGEKGEGMPSKKAPALNDKQIEEMELDLYDIKNGGTTMSSGTEHDVMEHNMKKLLDQGFDYDITEMAKFLEKSFYKKPAQ